MTHFNFAPLKKYLHEKLAVVKNLLNKYGAFSDSKRLSVSQLILFWVARNQNDPTRIFNFFLLDCARPSRCRRWLSHAQVHQPQINERIWRRTGPTFRGRNSITSKQLSATAHQQFSACLLAPEHHCSGWRVPPFSPEFALRISLKKIQIFQWVAKALGDLHQLLPLFLQDFWRRFPSSLFASIGLYREAARS